MEICNICSEKFNKSNRKFVKCMCDFECCCRKKRRNAFIFNASSNNY